MSQKIFTLWLTGLSASGKTTLGQAMAKRLKEKGYKVHHLDGDEVRAAAKVKLGFNREDRNKNIELAIGLAKKHQDKGNIVVACFISPFKKHRIWGRKGLKNYIEVFVDAPLEVCEARDPKGLYKKARVGELEHFTGISQSYEKPNKPQIHLKTDQISINECVNEIFKYLRTIDLFD